MREIEKKIQKTQYSLHCNATCNVILFLFLVSLSGCAKEANLLNSERIKQQFGSYGIDIVSASSDVRRSSLFSIDDGEKIRRTYAVVRFPQKIDAAFAAEHASVINGASLGATFKANSWRVDKRTLHTSELQVDGALSPVSAQMHIDGRQELAMHVYQLTISKNGNSFDYATIIEIHHPDYLRLDDVRTIYPADNTTQLTHKEALLLISLPEVSNRQ